MKILVLDFTDWKLKIINNIPKNIENDDYESFLYEKYNFNISEIEYMVVSELEIETL